MGPTVLYNLQFMDIAILATSTVGKEGYSQGTNTTFVFF